MIFGFDDFEALIPFPFQPVVPLLPANCLATDSFELALAHLVLDGELLHCQLALFVRSVEMLVLQMDLRYAVGHVRQLVLQCANLGVVTFLLFVRVRLVLRQLHLQLFEALLQRGILPLPLLAFQFLPSQLLADLLPVLLNFVHLLLVLDLPNLVEFVGLDDILDGVLQLYVLLLAAGQLLAGFGFVLPQYVGPLREPAHQQVDDFGLGLAAFDAAFVVAAAVLLE